MMSEKSKVSHAQAMADLKKLGYQPVGVKSAHGCEYEIMATIKGRKRVKLHARSYMAAHRYREGISSRLLTVVDEFVFWFERERWCYIVPSSWLLRISQRCKLKKNNEQWLCNLRAKDDVLEVVGDSQFDIEKFRVTIPVEAAP